MLNVKRTIGLAGFGAVLIAGCASSPAEPVVQPMGKKSVTIQVVDMGKRLDLF